MSSKLVTQRQALTATLDECLVASTAAKGAHHEAKEAVVAFDEANPGISALILREAQLRSVADRTERREAQQAQQAKIDAGAAVKAVEAAGGAS